MANQGFISLFLNNKQIARAVDEVINKETWRLYKRSAILSEWFPVKEIKRFDWKALMFKENAPIADLIAEGQEIPTVQFGKFEEIMAEVSKIGASYYYTAKMMKEMYQLFQDTDLASIEMIGVKDSEGKQLSELMDDNLMDVIFGSIKNLTKRVVDRLDAMTWEVAQTGRLSVSSNTTNIGINAVDFLRGKDHGLFPAPLTATGNATSTLNRWSDYQNANGLGNLYYIAKKYRDINGFPPEKIAMSIDAWNDLRQQKTTQHAATAMLGSIGHLSNDRLKDVIRDTLISPRTEIEILEDQYQIEDNQGNVTNVDFLNKDTIVLGCKGMGNRVVTPTIESASNRPIDKGSTIPKARPGIFIDTKSKEGYPILDYTVAIMNACPLVKDERRLSAWRIN